MKSYTFTSDAVGQPEPIVVQTVCRTVKVRQNDLDNATISFYVCAPAKTDSGVKYAPTAEWKAENNMFFKPLETIGYIWTESGSAVFAQEEQ